MYIYNKSWFLHSSLPVFQDTFNTYTVYDDIVTLSLVQETCSLLGKNLTLSMSWLDLLYLQ